MTDKNQLELPMLPPRDDAYAHWEGMPEFKQEDLTPIKQVIVSMRTEADVIAFANLIGQRLTLRGKSSIWYPHSPYHAAGELGGAE